MDMTALADAANDATCSGDLARTEHWTTHPACDTTDAAATARAALTKDHGDAPQPERNTA